MSVEATQWAWHQDTATPAQRLVLLALADNAAGPQTEHPGLCWPSIKTIAERCKIGERSVKRHLADLADLELITKHQRKRRADGSLSVWEYVVNYQGPPVAPRTESLGAKNDSLGAKTDSPRGQNVQSLGATCGPAGTVSEPSYIEPSEKNTATDELTLAVEVAPTDDGFKDFWQLYPRHEGKKAAGKAWAKMTDHQRNQAFKAVHGWISYAAEHPEGNTYVPHASTWLNQERYLEPVPAIPQPRRNKSTEALKRAMINRMSANREHGALNQ